MRWLLNITATAYFSTVAKTWKQTRCPSTDSWFMETSRIEYHSLITKEETWPFTETWMGQEMIIVK